MQYRRLGRSGLKVSAVSLGTWLTVGNSIDEKRSHDLVHAARDLGINLFDTADVYNRGEAESALGAVLTGLRREHLVVASKCFFPMSDDVNDRGLSRKHVHESLHRSLRRLRTDYLDVYQCHRHDPEVPLEETARAFDDLIRAGKVLYWGVSQWPAEAIAEVDALCRAAGYASPVSNQPVYNLFERGIEAAVAPACERAGLGLIVYSPLAQGALTGKYRVGEQPPSGSRAADPRINQFIGRYMEPQRLAQAQRLVELAKKHGHTAAQSALAFCLAHAGVASVIVGATSVAQLQDNVKAIDVAVTPELRSAWDAIFPAQ